MRSRAFDSRSVKRSVILLAALAVYVLVGLLYGHFAKHLSVFMPHLPWNFATLQARGDFERGILTLITSIGAIVFARIFALRYSGSQGWRNVPSSARLLDLVTLFLILAQLIFYNMGDEYLLVFLPFTLIVVGRYLGDWLNRFRVPIAIACLAMLLISAMWTRGLLASAEARWRGAEFACSTGVQPSEVSGPWTWVSYHRFEEFVTEAGSPAPLDFVGDFFYRWLPEQQDRARFWVTESLNAPADEKWEVLKEIPYQDSLFREKRVYVIRRVSRDQ